jgi:hypothetical protein
MPRLSQVSRRPDPAAQRFDAVRRYAPGQHVEYNSYTHGTWIEAIVKYVYANGTVDLDVRRGADPRYIREMSPRRPKLNQQVVSPQSPNPGQRFRVGERVQYHSQSRHCWVDATIREIHYDGTVDIDRDDGLYHTVDSSRVRKVVIRIAREPRTVRRRRAVRHGVVRRVNFCLD